MTLAARPVGEGNADPIAIFSSSADFSPIETPYVRRMCSWIAASRSKPPTLAERPDTTPPIETTAISVRPPPMSTIRFPIGSWTGRLAPTAAASGSSTGTTCRPPAYGSPARWRVVPRAMPRAARRRGPAASGTASRPPAGRRPRASVASHRIRSSCPRGAGGPPARSRFPAEHLPRLVAHRDHFAASAVQRDDGRLVEHDAVSQPIDQGVGATEIDREVAAQLAPHHPLRVTGHEPFLLPDRHVVLQPLDPVSASVEGFGSMWRRTATTTDAPRSRARRSVQDRHAPERPSLEHLGRDLAQTRGRELGPGLVVSPVTSPASEWSRTVPTNTQVPPAPGSPTKASASSTERGSAERRTNTGSDTAPIVSGGPRTMAG